MAVPLSIVAGSNPSLTVQLYPVANDLGNNGIDLTGVTAIAASAKERTTGAVVNFASAVVVSPATDGKVKLDYATNAFAVGVYQVQITFTDGLGKTNRYPSDGASLLLQVVAANS